MREIAVGDIHGKFRETEELLAAVRERYAPEAIRFVFVGDLVDRGPESAQVITLVSSLCQRGEAVCVLGNHDELFLQAVLLLRPDLLRTAGLIPEEMEPIVADFRFAPQRLLDHWITQGGGATLRSYGAVPRSPDTWDVIAREHLQFVAMLPLAWSGEHFDVSHARGGAQAILHGVACASRPWELPEAVRNELLWNRNEPEDPPERLHVSGHTPREEPLRRRNAVEIDTGCVFGHRLTAFDPQDDLYLQVPCSMH